ncbi:MAG: hypothetical protein M1484_02925 [Patescibacteria group bacterium]|nr:hypothetical protein [Patescibacteria group bacterium]
MDQSTIDQVNKLKELAQNAGFSSKTQIMINSLADKLSRGNEVSREEIESVFEQIDAEINQTQNLGDDTAQTATDLAGAAASIKQAIGVFDKGLENTNKYINKGLDEIEARIESEAAKLGK